MTDTNNYNKITDIGFNISSRFSQLIGRQLISNPIIAVLELVKNSYDADSKNINIRFENLKSGTSRLIIDDDGDGMNLQDLTTKWMVVGTENKLIEKRTKSGRRKLGEKGIGRFSVERLARKTIIETKTAEDTVLIELDIDWDKYENQEKFFNEVKHPIKYMGNPKKKKGTKIILEDLRDIWTEDDIADLRKELFLLIPIDIGKLSSNFSTDVNINFECDEYPNKTGDFHMNFLKYYHARLYGEIFENGEAKLELELRIREVNSHKERKLKYERILKKDEHNYMCGPVIFEAYAFLRDGRLYRGLEIDKSFLTKVLNEYSGIKIYRDEFRVKPFGDPDNDWLGLNLERVKSPEYRLSTNQVIGGVKIGRDKNPGLQDVLSRENLYDTDEFVDLVRFVNDVFNYYTYASFVELRKAQKDIRDRREEIYSKVVEASTELKKVVNDGKQKLDEKRVEIETKINDVNKKQNSNENNSQTDKDTSSNYTGIIDETQKNYEKIKAVTEKMENEIQLLKEQLKEKEKFRERELQIYRNIASLGISAAQFGHETEKLVLNSYLAVRRVNRSPEIIKIKDEKVLRDLADMEKYMDSANQKADFFRGYLMREKQEKEEKLSIIKVFQEVIYGFINSFKDIGVNIELISRIDKDIMINGYYGDFESIITNLITNAYKALTQGPQENRFFKIVMDINDNLIILESINSGKPIEFKDREHIFEPMFTTHKHGTGLGLPIIEDTLKQYGGSIKLEDDYPITKFKILIPLASEV